MDNIKKLLKDLSEINKIFQATYGESGKSALIQFTNKENSINSFTTTNDGNTILATMSFFQNNLLKLFSNTIQRHSESNGDNCKTLFFYAFQILEDLGSLEHYDLESVIFSLRTRSVSLVYQALVENFANISDFTRNISGKSNFLKVLPNLTVLYDLKNSNEVLSNTSSNLIIALLNYLCSDLDTEVTEIIHESLVNFETCFYFSCNQSLSGSRVLTDGFLVDRRFVLKQANLHDGPIRVVLLQKLNIDATKSNDIVRIESNLQSSVFGCLNSGTDVIFSREFLDGLKLNNIRVILTSEVISDVKKAQLNSIGCSLVSFIDYKFIEFLSNSLKVKTLTSRSFREEIKASCFVVSGIESLENEKLLYFRLNEQELKLAFIYFCAPSKIFAEQFKTYFKKVMRTILSIDDSFEGKNMLISVKQFEKLTGKTFQGLEGQSESYKDKIFFKFLASVFNTLDLKLNKRIIGKKLFNRAKSDTLLLQNSSMVCNDQYEPLMLKMSCLLQALQLVQSILRIENVYYVRKRMEAADMSDDADL